jgi:hypothetical protein
LPSLVMRLLLLNFNWGNNTFFPLV